MNKAAAVFLVIAVQCLIMVAAFQYRRITTLEQLTTRNAHDIRVLDTLSIQDGRAQSVVHGRLTSLEERVSELERRVDVVQGKRWEPATTSILVPKPEVLP